MMVDKIIDRIIEGTTWNPNLFRERVYEVVMPKDEVEAGGIVGSDEHWAAVLSPLKSRGA